MAVVVSDLGEVTDTGTDASSFSYGSFGAAASDRVLIAAVLCADNNTNFTANSPTIGGVAANLVQVSPQAMESNAIIYSAAVPTGTSGTAANSWSEAVSFDQQCTLVGVTGLATAVLYDTAVAEATDAQSSMSVNIDVPAGGLVVAAFCARAAVITLTGINLANSLFNGIPADTGWRGCVFYEVFASAQTNLTVTASFSATSTDRVLVVASFEAAAVIPTGTGAGMPQALTGSSSGLAAAIGTGAGTTATATGSASSVHGVAGTAAATAQTLTGVAIGLTTVAGTATGDLQATIGAASGVHGVAGTGAGIASATTCSASGMHGVAGAVAGEVAAATGAGAGAQGAAGTAAGTTAETTGSGVGEVGDAGDTAVEGAGSSTLPGLTGGGVGEVEFGEPAEPHRMRLGQFIPVRPRKQKTKPVRGEGRGQLPALVGEAYGRQGVLALAAGGPSAVIGRGRGRQEPTAEAKAVLPLPSAAGAGCFDHHSDDELAIIAATLAA